MVGGMHGRGACMAGGHAWQGGMHGRGRAWQGCVRGRGVAWHMVNERAVRILLECILVVSVIARLIKLKMLVGHALSKNQLD